MFLYLYVILFTGHLCPGSLCPGGVCPGGVCPEGSLSRGVTVQGSSSRGSLSRAVSVQDGLCPGGLCREGLFAQRGVSVGRGLCPEGVSRQGVSLSGRPPLYGNVRAVLLYLFTCCRHGPVYILDFYLECLCYCLLQVRCRPRRSCVQ